MKKSMKLLSVLLVVVMLLALAVNGTDYAAGTDADGNPTAALKTNKYDVGNGCYLEVVQNSYYKADWNNWIITPALTFKFVGACESNLDLAAAYNFNACEWVKEFHYYVNTISFGYDYTDGADFVSTGAYALTGAEDYIQTVTVDAFTSPDIGSIQCSADNDTSCSIIFSNDAKIEWTLYSNTNGGGDYADDVLETTVTAIEGFNFPEEGAEEDVACYLYSAENFQISFDTLYMDGVSMMDEFGIGDGQANVVINENEITAEESVTVRGWAGFNDHDEFDLVYGYAVNEGEKVYDEDFLCQRDDVQSIIGEFANGFEVEVPVNKDATLVSIYAKDAAGVETLMIEFSVNGQYVKKAPTPVEPTPVTPDEPTPVAPATQTADLAVVAILALGAFAVAKKH